MKNYCKTCLFLILFLGLISCGKQTGSKGDTLSVVVSIPPEKTIVEEIAGDDVNVVCLMSSDANPESFEPAMSDMMKLQNSSLYFSMGVLPFEKKLKKSVEENNSNVVVVNVSDGVDLIYGSHCDGDEAEEEDDDEPHHHHDSNEADPHVWSAPKNIKIMSENIFKALCEINPAKESFYKENYNKLASRIDSIDAAVIEHLNGIESRSFLVWHPSLSYFAREYGLEQIVVGSHNKDLSVGQLKARLEKAKQSGGEVFFVQQEFDSEQATLLTGETKTRIVRINPMNQNWEEEIKKITYGL